MTDDIFTMFVTTDQGHVSRVVVMAPTINDATLTALQMVAARGQTPVSVDIDWDNF